MLLSTTVLALFAFIAPALSAPTKALEPRGPSQCGQYSSISTGSYTIYTNEWGASTGTGSQCSQIDGLSGSSLAWSTTWSWSGGTNSMCLFPHVPTLHRRTYIDHPDTGRRRPPPWGCEKRYGANTTFARRRQKLHQCRDTYDIQTS